MITVFAHNVSDHTSVSNGRVGTGLAPYQTATSYSHAKNFAYQL